MARAPASTEERTIKALREAGAITGPERDAAITALSATETCTKCDGSGNAHPSDEPPGCDRCQGTGQQYVIR